MTYKIDPWLTAGGGLAGAGAGLTAYWLDPEKTKKKLYTYLAVGSALGVGTTALATLKEVTDKNSPGGGKDKDQADKIKPNIINKGFNTNASLIGGGTGFGLAEAARHANALRMPGAKFIGSPTDRMQAAQMAAEEAAKIKAANPNIDAKAAEKLGKMQVWANRRGYHHERAGGWHGLGTRKRTGKLAVDLVAAGLGIIAGNLINNARD